MDNTTPPNCKTCGQPVSRFIKSKNKWWDWCSNKCMGTDPEILLKKQQTNQQRFGASHPMHLPEIKTKLKKVFIEKYGVDNPSKSNKVKDKMKETFLEKYGVDNPSKDNSVIKKIQEKAIQRYSDDKDSILTKRRETSLKKFGVETNKHLHIPKESIHLMKDIEWLTYQHIELKKSCEQIARELGVSPTPILLFLTRNNINIKRHNTSTQQAEIVNFIKSIYSGEIISNDRKSIFPKEIDIFIPEYSLGIELNGTYWHSEEKGKDQFYHIEKTILCESKGIHLLHVYDSEWLDPIKRKIIESKLLHLLKKSNKVYARKCIIKELTNPECETFLNHNHLQGNCPSKIKIGLEIDNQLVAVATFGKSRFNKKYDWELLRYCNKTKTSVVGGLSKLISYVSRKYDIKNLISYADRRWSNNINHNLYSSTGFVLLKESTPNYKYFKMNDAHLLMSRNQFQKHMLKNKLELYDEKLSEYENMSMNGYYRIWDCGNLVYEWKND